MDLIFKCKKDLQLIRKCKTIRERRKLIKNSKKCLIDAISEISASFSTTEKLYDYVKKIHPSLKKSLIDQWLLKQNTYTLHKENSQKFQEK
jgi:hypothetical protein